MNGENLPLLLILVLAVIGDNTSVSVAVLVLLLIKFLGLGSWLPVIQNHGLNLGIIILTVGVLAPLAQGGVSIREMLAAFKGSTGFISIAVGIFVSWMAGRGVPFVQGTPEVVTSLIVGTIIGVCFFHGLAIGPLIAGGLVSLIVSMVQQFHS